MALLPVEQALENILAGTSPKKEVILPLIQAGGRVLSQDLKAQRTHPPFNASAMDGYAVNNNDIKDLPSTLKVIGEASAGGAFDDKIQSGEAVRIFTGAPVPEGADCIAIQENCNRDGDMVTVLEDAPQGKFIRPMGLDFTKGDIGLKVGRQLDSNALALAASMNHAELPVYTKPKVAILATGSELVYPGETPSADQIIASNTYGIAHIIRENGGEVLDMGIIKDELDTLKETILSALEQGADIIVTLGGASVGDYDLVHPAFTQLGAEFAFWKVAMRPGKPLMFGTINGVKILGLPGNPVSSLVCGEVYLKPLVLKSCGLPYENLTKQAFTKTSLQENDQRQDYMRAYASINNGQIEVEAFSRQDSSMLKTLSEANCLLIRPPYAKSLEIGESCEILPIGLIN
jgi:molybdopterin molybdotransferase